MTDKEAATTPPKPCGCECHKEKGPNSDLACLDCWECEWHLQQAEKDLGVKLPR